MTNDISRRGLWRLIFPVLMALVVYFGGVSTARANSKSLSGTLTTHQVDCPTLCTAGTLTGTLAGTFSWTMSSMTATSIPDVFILYGDFVITTSSGTLTGTDITLWNVATGQ